MKHEVYVLILSLPMLLIPCIFHIPQVNLFSSLPTNQEVPSSILGSVVGFLVSGETFYGIYGLSVSVFHCCLSKF